MNNAKMWLVVKPTVGVPLFLSAVAVGSFAVHVAVLSNTSWVSDFLSGEPLGTGDAETAALDADKSIAKAGYTVENTDGSREVMVMMPDGTVTKAVLQSEVMALSTEPPTIAAN